MNNIEKDTLKTFAKDIADARRNFIVKGNMFASICRQYGIDLERVEKIEKALDELLSLSFIVGDNCDTIVYDLFNK